MEFFLLIITGLIAVAFLIFGADWLVERCSKVAEYIGVSKAFIGLTVISIGTSIPEIMTHVVASIKIVTGEIDPDIASATVLGTNIGSDIVQQNFIIGVVALLGTVIASKAFLRRDYIIMIGAAILLFIIALDGTISHFEGAMLVVLYIGYLMLLWHDEHKHTHKHKVASMEKRNLFVDFGFIAFSLVVVVLSAEHILEVATVIVNTFDVGASLIGIVILGVSTALPELTTALVGIYKKNTAMSVGTLVGSNITNPMFALGVGAAISSYSVPLPVMWFDIPVKIITSCIILIFLWHGTYRGKLGVSKTEAVIMILMYLIYIFIRTQFLGLD